MFHPGKYSHNQVFSGAVSFTMLHHVPSPALQDQLVAETYRVLRPDGVFVGTDSMPSLFMRAFHICDRIVPVEPASLKARLGSVGFIDVEIEIGLGKASVFCATTVRDTILTILGQEWQIDIMPANAFMNVGSRPSNSMLLPVRLCFSRRLRWANLDSTDESMAGVAVKVQYRAGDVDA